MELDRSNTFHNNNKAKEEVLSLMDEFCLKDVWRVRNGDRREYSWFKMGQVQKASRIDYALISGGIDQQVKLIQYIASLKTDHRAIYMVLELQNYERGAGYWKFNVSLLQKFDFVQKMRTEIESTLCSSKEKDSTTKWELLKSRVKKVASDYAKSVSSQDKLTIAALSEKVNEYEETFPLNREDLELYTKT